MFSPPPTYTGTFQIQTMYSHDQYPSQYVYFLPNQTNIYDDHLRVAMFDVSLYLRELLPKTKKFFEDPWIKYMNLWERILFSDPSIELRLRVKLKLLQDVWAYFFHLLPESEKKKRSGLEPFNVMWTLDGEIIDDLL